MICKHKLQFLAHEHLVEKTNVPGRELSESSESGKQELERAIQS
jgi:hypothetical protein